MKAKSIAGFPLLTKIHFSHYGEAANSPHFRAALGLAQSVKHLFYLLHLERTGQIKGGSEKSIFWPERRNIQRCFLRQMQKSLLNHDGSFWRAFADAIEADPKGVRPAWGYVGTQIGCAEAENRPRPTNAQLTSKLTKMLGREVDPKETRRILKYLELEEPKKKAGRPRKRK
jgi:hypothetical protein